MSSVAAIATKMDLDGFDIFQSRVSRLTKVRVKKRRMDNKYKMESNQNPSIHVQNSPTLLFSKEFQIYTLWQKQTVNKG